MYNSILMSFIFSQREKIKLMQNPIILDLDQVENVYILYHTFPDVVSSRNALHSMVLPCPPHIRMKGMGKMTDDLTETLWTYWLPWQKAQFDWIHMIGVCPWRFERIDGTEDEWYPRVPPFHAGCIKTYLDKSKKQQFRYYWNNSSTHDSRMNFTIYHGYEPDLMGTLNSPMAALLPEYMHMLKIRNALQAVTERQLNPQNIIEFTPARNKTSDQDAIMTLQYGEDIAMRTVEDRERLNQAQYQVSRAKVNQILMDAAYRNAGKTPPSMLSTGAGRVIFADAKDPEEWRTQNANLFDNTAILPADYHYKPVQTPKIQAQLDVVCKRLSEQAAKVMGYSGAMMGSGSSGGSKSRSLGAASLNLRYVNETVKRWSKFFTREFKLAFVFAYDTQLAKARNEKGRKRPRITDQLKQETNFNAIEITSLCTPLADVEQVHTMQERGFISRETSGKYQVALVGLDEKDFDLQPLPTPEQQQMMMYQQTKRPRRQQQQNNVMTRETRKLI